MNDHNAVKVSWPDPHDRRAVTLRPHAGHLGPSGTLIGYVRSVGNVLDSTGRYFAEDHHKVPIEGTHKTRKAATQAVIDQWKKAQAMEEVERRVAGEVDTTHPINDCYPCATVRAMVLDARDNARQMQGDLQSVSLTITTSQGTHAGTYEEG